MHYGFCSFIVHYNTNVPHYHTFSIIVDHKIFMFYAILEIMLKIHGFCLISSDYSLELGDWHVHQAFLYSTDLLETKMHC